jgi:DNA-binding NarL/FixJ family response regulator
MAAARIILADDHDLVRQGLASLIDAQPDLSVVGQAGDGLSALSLARELRPDLVIMDLSMPISDGVEATRLIKAVMPEINVLILTVRDDDNSLFQAIKSGARGYLLKSCVSATFLQGVRALLAGEAVLPPRLAMHLLDEYTRVAGRAEPAGDAGAEELTPRELEVLRCLARGGSDKAIAAELSISLYTVKSHVRGILNKLHASNRAQAARRAAQAGLLKKVVGDKLSSSPQRESKN